jgi:predicted Zn-dependent protease
MSRYLLIPAQAGIQFFIRPFPLFCDVDSRLLGNDYKCEWPRRTNGTNPFRTAVQNASKPVRINQRLNLVAGRIPFLRRHSMRKMFVAGTMAVLVALSLANVAFAGGDDKDIDNIGNRKVAHRSIISEEKEIAIGKQYADQIDQQAKIVKDPVVAEYVNRVAQNIARNSDLKVPLTVKVIDDPVINAFALPGGFLYVNTGTILAADEEDELAGVMAHEIAHVAARHWASQMTKMTLLNYATIPLIFIPMTYPVYLGVSQAMNIGIPVVFLKFSRSAEAEADYLGLQYMYKAGYDPNSYVTFFGKVMQEERREPGSVPKIFADHPPTADRIIKCQEEITELLPKKDQYLVTTSEFNDVQGRLKSLVAQWKRHQPTGGPTLEKRESKRGDAGAQTTSGSGTSGSSDDDKPPVLKRRD